MRLHPVFRTLVSQPDLLVEHAGAYAELASAEMAMAAHQLKARAAMAVASIACAALGASLTGTALLLVAVTPLQEMAAPWALIAAPAVPLLAAGALWWAQSRRAVDLSFGAVREQMQIDRAVWRRL